MNEIKTEVPYILSNRPQVIDSTIVQLVDIEQQIKYIVQNYFDWINYYIENEEVFTEDQKNNAIQTIVTPNTNLLFPFEFNNTIYSFNEILQQEPIFEWPYLSKLKNGSFKSISQPAVGSFTFNDWINKNINLGTTNPKFNLYKDMFINGIKKNVLLKYNIYKLQCTPGNDQVSISQNDIQLQVNDGLRIGYKNQFEYEYINGNSTNGTIQYGIKMLFTAQPNQNLSNFQILLTYTNENIINTALRINGTNQNISPEINRYDGIDYIDMKNIIPRTGIYDLTIYFNNQTIIATFNVIYTNTIHTLSFIDIY